MCVSAAWRRWKVARPVTALHRGFRQIRDSTLLAYLHTGITESLHSCILNSCKLHTYWSIADLQRWYRQIRDSALLAYLHTCILAYLHTCTAENCILTDLLLPSTGDSGRSETLPSGHTCILAFMHTWTAAACLLTCCCPPPVIQADQRLYPPCILAYVHICILAYLNSFKLHTYLPVAALHRWYRQIRDYTLHAYLHTCILALLQTCTAENCILTDLLPPSTGDSGRSETLPSMHTCIFAYLHNWKLA